LQDISLLDNSKQIIQQKDFSGRNLLYYMRKLNTFPLLDTNLMDRIVQDYWYSNLDTRGNFMGASTAYQILTKYKLSFSEDFESKNRFYHVKNRKE